MNVIRTPTAVLAIALLLLIGCATSLRAAVEEKSGLNHLGKHTFKVTTRSREAQQAFNRGLIWAYSFGHSAAEQEFRKALAADPNCAMAWWGIALVNGPHINFPTVPPDK